MAKELNPLLLDSLKSLSRDSLPGTQIPQKGGILYDPKVRFMEQIN